MTETSSLKRISLSLPLSFSHLSLSPSLPPFLPPLSLLENVNNMKELLTQRLQMMMKKKRRKESTRKRRRRKTIIITNIYRTLLFSSHVFKIKQVYELGTIVISMFQMSKEMSFQRLKTQHESKGTIRLLQKLFWSQGAQSGQKRELVSQVY